MLKTEFHPNEARQFTRHFGPVTCVAGIPHRRAAVTSAYDGGVGYFDFDTGQTRLLGYHDHLVNRIAVNAAGTQAASSGSDYTIRLWDLTTMRETRVLRGHSDDVEGFAFVNDHQGVSVGNNHDPRVLVWNLGTGAIERAIDGHLKAIGSVDFYRGRIFTSGDDGTLRMWDLATGRTLRVWGPLEHEADSCAIDPVHGRAVQGCDDHKIRVFDIDSGDLLTEFHAHESAIKKVATSPANGDILSAAYDQQVLIWSAADYSLKVHLEHKPAIWERSFNWSPDGKQILGGTFDGTVMAWDATTGNWLGEYGDPGTGNICLNELSANGAGEIVTVSDDGFVRLALLTPEKACWLARVEPASGRMLANAVTIDDATGLVVAGAHNQKLHIFQRVGNELVNEVEVALNEGPINSVRVSNHAGHVGQIFAATYHGVIARVDPSGEILGMTPVHDASAKALRLHPERPFGVSCSADGVVAAWDLDGRVHQRFLIHDEIGDDIDFDPTGKLVATVSRDFTMKVTRIDDGRLLHSVRLGTRSPKAVCFFDPQTVIVTNYWGALIRIDLRNCQPVMRQIAQNGFSSIVRSGQHVVASSYDGAAYLVDPSDLSVVRTLRAMTQRPRDFALE